jgi:sec-independent protein translocase protein TatC
VNDVDDMSLVEHLGELRKRIFWVLLVFISSTLVGLYFSDRVINWLRAMPPADQIAWHAFSPWDSIRIYMQFSFAIGFMITLPYLLFQLWGFVKPGLRQREQKASLKYIPFAFVLFLVGVAFSYFIVFKMALLFTNLMTERLGLEQTYGITQYFTFMFNIVLPISILFELPIVVMFLTAIRLLNPLRLRKFRRYAYFILLIVSSIVTPPDVISAVIVMIPLVLLYELSVFLSGIVYRKQLLKEQAWEAEYGPK